METKPSVIYTKYKTATGEIAGTFQTTETVPISDYVKSDESFLEGDYDGNVFKIVNGKPEKKGVSELSRVNIELFREERNYRLSKSDWTQANDSPLSEEKKLEWQQYRQKLRDLPSDYPMILDLGDVIYPQEPE